jgi:hypothetical protein
MPHRIGLAIVCLHISSILYVLVGFAFAAGMYFLGESPGDVVFGFGMLVFCILLGLGMEVVAYGLRGRRFWAWIAGLCIFAMFLPSLFLPLGALGLWGLLDAGSRAEFGVGTHPHRD